MRERAIAAVLNAIIQESRVSAAVLDKVERAETEDAIEIKSVDVLMTRKELTLRIQKEAITIRHETPLCERNP